MTLFSSVEPVAFKGPDSTDEFAYRVYDKDRRVLGKRMEDWLRVAVCYWHSFNWPGQDIFGAGTLPRPWLGLPVTQEMADTKLEAAFDFFMRLGVRYFTFHDVDAMVPAATLQEHARNMRKLEEAMAGKMERTDVRLLWGTANLFSHPRYAGGAATSPDPEVYAWAAAQVRACLETTQRLGGENYVVLGRLEGLGLDQNGALESDAMLVLHDHRQEPAVLIELPPQVRVQQRVVAFATAPQHVVLPA